MTDTTSETKPTVDHKKYGFGVMTKGGDDSKSGDKDLGMWVAIDDIDVDYSSNIRAPMYTWPSDSLSPLAGKPCSFCDADCLDLFDSLPREGQLEAVLVSVNPVTRRHALEEGYRRYYAVARLRDKGIKVPGGYALRVSKVAKPKDSEQWAARNLRAAAMQALKPLSAMDIAILAERMTKPKSAGGGGMKEDDARASLIVLCQHNPNFRTIPGEESISEAQFKKLLRLTALNPETKLAIHEGRLSWTKALGNASKRGEGNVRGPAGPQTPRGFKPREAVAYATSDAFAAEIPETVLKADVLALLGYAGNAETTPPAWLAKAKAAHAAALSEATSNDAGAKRKKAPLRVAEIRKANAAA